MDDAKRRALIKAQAAKKKESGDVAPLAIVAINPSIKGSLHLKVTVSLKNLKFL